MKHTQYPAFMFVAVALPIFVLLLQSVGVAPHANAAATCLSISRCVTPSVIEIPTPQHGQTKRVTSYKMGQIYNRLVNQDAAVFFIGDSTAAPETVPRWSLSIKSKWDVPWVGVVAGRYESSAGDQGLYSTFNQTTNPANANGLLVPVSLNYAPPDVSVANDTIMPARAITTVVSDGDITLQNVMFDGLSNYLRGDWTRGKTITARVLLHGTLNGAQNTNGHFQFQRDGVNVAQLFNQDLSVPAGAFRGKDFTAFSAQNTPASRVGIILGAGGSNSTFHGHGIELFQKGATGFSLWAMGISGSNTKNWLHRDGEPTGAYTQTQIRNSFGMLSRKINTFIIQLGINGLGDEVNTPEGRAAYKGRISTIIDQWKADAESANPSLPVMFLVINPWWTPGNGSSAAWAAARGEVLNEIARERSYVSYIDMDAVMNTHLGPGWQATYLSDGIHQNTAGALKIGELSWREILTGASVQYSNTLETNALGRDINGVVNSPLAEPAPAS